MRVLTICPELPRTGSPGSMAPTARQIRSLRQVGLSVDVVDLRGIPKLKYVQVVPKIRRLANHADVIHAHFGYCGWLGWMAPLFSSVKAPLVVSFMGDDLLGTPSNAEGDLEWFSRRMVSANKILARHANQVIVKSRQMAETIAPVRATVIANGVDIDTFYPTAREVARRQLGLDPARTIALFPGNPDNLRKGHRLASLATEIASRQLGQPIDLLPLWGVAPQRVAVYMNACNAMLMTSLIEGSPNVVKEAMACNVPIVSVPVGDVPEILDGVCGCAVCARDPAAIAKKLVEHAAGSSDAAEPLADNRKTNGREMLLRRRLDLESVAYRIVSVYEQAIGRPIRLSGAFRHASSPSRSRRPSLST